MTDNTATTWDEVRRIADELQLKMHLAGMDARARWTELQPRLVDLEKSFVTSGQRAGEAVTKQLASIGAALKQLRDEISQKLEPKN